MARRGTPLQQFIRDEVKRLRRENCDMSFRAIARKLGISHPTAKKYAKQVFPKSLSEVQQVA